MERNIMIVRKELTDTHLVLALREAENHELRAWQVKVKLRVSMDLQALIAQAIIRCEARRRREINTRPWDTAVERLYDYSTFIDMAQDMLKGLLT